MVQKREDRSDWFEAMAAAMRVDNVTADVVVSSDTSNAVSGLEGWQLLNRHQSLDIHKARRHFIVCGDRSLCCFGRRVMLRPHCKS